MSKPRPLQNYLMTSNHDIGRTVFLNVNPGSQFGYLAQVDGTVERVKGQVHVPMHDWQAAGIDENEVVASVLITAADANPLKLASPSKIDKTVWTKLRGMVAMMLNPSLFGKFQIPLGADIIQHEGVPGDRLIILGPSNMIGYFVKQGGRRNILAHNKHGLTSVQFYIV